MNLRPPLFAFFVLVTCFAVLTIVALVLWLDTFQADAARRAADSAVTGSLLHGVEIIAEPLKTVQLIAKQAALMANQTQDFCDDERTDVASMLALNQQSQAILKANDAPFYVYQTITHRGHWTFSGCGRAECMFAANGTQYWHSVSFPYNGSITWIEDFGAVYRWHYDDTDYIKAVKSMTYADAEGFFSPFEAAAFDGLISSIQVPLRFAPNGTCVLAQGVDIVAVDLRKRLLTLTLPRTTVTLLDTDRQLLLATTADIGLPNDRQFVNDTSSVARGVLRLMRAAEIPNAAVHDAVDRTASMMAALTKPAVIDAGGKDIVGVAPVIVLNSRLTIVTVTERDFFYSTLADTRRSAAIIGSVGAALCVLVSAVVCLLVSVALHRLRAAMVPAAKLRLSPEELEAAGRSVVRDVAALQDAFAEMNSRLHEAGAYIPHALRVAWSEQDGSAPDDTEDDDAIAQHRTSAADMNDGTQYRLRSPPMESPLSAIGEIVDPRGVASEGARSARSGKFSSPGVSQRASSHRDSHLNSPPITKQLQLSWTARATLLSINLRGFSEHTASKTPAEVCAVADAFAKVVFDAAVKHRGVVDSFQGDRFLVTFNASAVAAAHSTKAASCALDIRNRITGGAVAALGGSPSISCGVASSTLIVGDIGCNVMKRFGLIGHAFTRALALERLCCSYGPTEYCAVAASAFADLAAHFSITPVDFVKLPGSAAPSSVGVLGKKLEGTDNEWLYVVGQGPAHATEGPAAVLHHLVSGHRDLAFELWQTMADRGPSSGRPVDVLTFNNVRALMRREHEEFTVAADSASSPAPPVDMSPLLPVPVYSEHNTPEEAEPIPNGVKLQRPQRNSNSNALVFNVGEAAATLLPLHYPLGKHHDV